MNWKHFLKALRYQKLLSYMALSRTYNDLPWFVKGNLALLKSGELKGLAATVRFKDLNELKEALEKNTEIQK